MLDYYLAGHKANDLFMELCLPRLGVINFLVKHGTEELPPGNKYIILYIPPSQIKSLDFMVSAFLVSVKHMLCFMFYLHVGRTVKKAKA